MIEVICGGMFSGKTTKLLERIERAELAKQTIQLFRPRIDTRSPPESTSTHKGAVRKAIVIDQNTPWDILKLADADLIAIDEAQFFSKTLVWVVKELVRLNPARTVVCSGLDLDALENPFGPVPELMALADELTKLNAVCMVCGKKATRSFRKLSSQPYVDSEVVLVGAREYEARCSACYRAGHLDHE